VSRPVRKMPLPSDNPHGKPVSWDCVGCHRFFAAYEGQTPKGWKRDDLGRAVCPRCAKGGR
jgi:hypothetical protein